MNDGFRRYKLTPDFIDRRERISKTCKNYWNNISDEDRQKHSEAISNGRNNMSDDAKKLRGDRVREAFASSEKRKEYTKLLKIERLGIDNPASKKICWHGEILTKMQFEKTVGDLTDDMIQYIIQQDDCYFLYDPYEKVIYESITCPHCGKNSNGNKQSSFKRWHFNNCKHKEV